MIDIQCGHCDTVFTIQNENLLNRSNEPYNLHPATICPNCLEHFPSAQGEHLKELIKSMNDGKGWRVGLRFHETYREK